MLYIEASPRGTRFHSSAVAKEFLAVYKDAHAQDEVETLNLLDADLPAFNGDMLKAKYAILAGETHSSEQAAAWGRVTKLAEYFKSTD